MSIGLIILIITGLLVIFGAGQRALDRLRLTDKQALLCIALIIGLGFVPDIPLGGNVAINLGGCLLLGLLNGLFLRHDSLLHPDLRAALTVGLCGGFTTFSTFSQESVNLLRHGLWGAGLGYIALSLLLGLALFAVGLWLGQRCI